MEVLGQQRVPGLGRDQALLVVIVGKSFRRGDQRRAQHRRLRPLGQHPCHAPSVGDAARGRHRHAGHGQHLLQQHGQRRAAAHMAAGFHALGDQHLGAGFLGLQRFQCRADLVDHHDAGFAQLRDHGRVHVPEQPDHGHAQRNAQRELRAQQRLGRGRRNQVHAEGTGSAPAHLRHFGADQAGRLAHHAQKAETAGLGHGRHQFGTRHAAHAGQQERLAAAQQIAQGRGGKGEGIGGWIVHGGTPVQMR
ncbi:hypothetical protein D3C78_1170170 [compost metagenome]